MNGSAGIVMIGIGAVIALWALTSLRWPRFTGRHSADPPLTFRGPYRRVRHPFCLGVLLMVAGVVMRAPSARSGAALCVAVVLIALSIAAEERRLLARFGEAYRRYRSRVPAVLPVRLLNR